MSSRAQEIGADAAVPKASCPIPEGIDPNGVEGSLRSNMIKMNEIADERIFMVRGIGKLGLKSAEILKEHFKQIGPVEEVFVTHAFNKSHTSMRAAGRGWVAMEKVEDVRLVLQREQHEILGVSVSTHKIERSRCLD